MVTLLDPPLCSPNLKCRLTTVSEAIDYIDTRLPEHEQSHRLVQAAREVLYRAEDTAEKRVASGKLANALLVLDVNRT